MAELLSAPRCLIVLDDYHSQTADRSNVILEYQYGQLASTLDPETLRELEERVDNLLLEKNKKRTEILGQPPLSDRLRDFALLQEVTKAACRKICGNVTVAHTAKTVYEFSVTSFYKAGLDLGLIEKGQMVQYKI